MLIVASFISVVMLIWFACRSNRQEKHTPVTYGAHGPPSQGTFIPHVVHMTHSDLTKIPKYVLDRVTEHCSDLTVEYSDDAACELFLRTRFGSRALEIFRGFEEGAHKADFWRFCKLYVDGGVYLDIKTDFQFPLSAVFDFARPRTWYTVVAADRVSLYNGIIATPPGNPVIGNMVDYMWNNTKPSNYFEYIRAFMYYTETACQKPWLGPGTHHHDDWTCVLYKEGCSFCMLRDSSCDRYGMKCDIRDGNSQVLFRTRYNDYPW